jgi:ankyrin repeat protein
MSAFDDELLDAALANNLAAVKAALENGANADAHDTDGRTALMVASLNKAIPIIQVLLQAGAGVNLQAEPLGGMTALIMAAIGHILSRETIELLLANGADPNIADHNKKTPLMWLVDTQFHGGGDTSESIAPLVRAGARINDRDAPSSGAVPGRTALIWAVSGDGPPFPVRDTILARLIENGADVNATDSNGETAMFNLVRNIGRNFATRPGQRCIQILVDAGADRNPINSAGQTPLAVVRSTKQVIDFLRHLGFTE